MRKNTKLLYRLLSLLVLMASISSCGDETDDPGMFGGDYFLRCKIDGNLVEYTNQLGLSSNSSMTSTQYTMVVTGFNDASSNIGLQLYDGAPFMEGSYSGYGFVGSYVSGVIIGYLDPVSGLVFGSGGGPTVDAEIVLTELTDTYVRGTFRGFILHSGEADKEVTEGEFYVKRNS